MIGFSLFIFPRLVGWMKLLAVSPLFVQIADRILIDYYSSAGLLRFMISTGMKLGHMKSEKLHLLIINVFK